MYCPSCGIECNDERNFCNGCGINLSILKKTVHIAKNINTTDIGQIKQSFVLEKEWNKFLSRGLIFICVGLLYSLAVFIVGFIIKKYFNADLGRLLKDFSILGTLFLLIGMMIICYGRIKFRSKHTNLAITELLLAENQSDELTQKALAPEKVNDFNNYVPFSVIERTTKELKQVNPPFSNKTKEN